MRSQGAVGPGAGDGVGAEAEAGGEGRGGARWALPPLPTIYNDLIIYKRFQGWPIWRSDVQPFRRRVVFKALSFDVRLSTLGRSLGWVILNVHPFDVWTSMFSRSKVQSVNHLAIQIGQNIYMMSLYCIYLNKTWNKIDMLMPCEKTEGSGANFFNLAT
jgi:hypothetical protein